LQENPNNTGLCECCYCCYLSDNSIKHCVGGWCWISAEKNCKQPTAGLWEQTFLWYIPYMFISLTCIVLMLIAVSVFVKEVCCNYKNRKHHQHGHKNNRRYRKHYEVLGKVVIQLIVLVPIILDFIIFALRASGDYSSPVWVIFAIGPPSIGFLIPLSLTLYIQCRQDEPNTIPNQLQRFPLTHKQSHMGHLKLRQLL